MNIAKAFVERNRLKKFISEKSDMLRYAKLWHNKDDGDRNWQELGGDSVEQLLDKVLIAKEKLGEFNKAIDAANMKGPRQKLDELESLFAQSTTLQTLTNEAKNFKEKEVLGSNGVLYTTINVMDIDFAKLNRRLKDVKKLMQKTEDEISSLNASIEVELSDDLKNYLESYDD